MIGELKPYAEYKDSGLPWLPTIPAHWQTVRNGSLFGQRSETGYSDLPILEVSLKTGVRVRAFGSEGRKQVMSDLAKYKRAAKGDLAYNTMRMWQGAVGVCPVDGLVSPAYVVASPRAGADSAYFAAMFRTNAYMAEIDSASRGIVKDRNRLYWEQFKQMRSPCPPPTEQAAIVRLLDWANGRLERAIRAKRKVIALLTEQKQVIVKEAVVRGLDTLVELKQTNVPWLGAVPAHWEILSLGRLSTARCDGPFGSGLKSMHYTESGVQVIRLQNIGVGEFRDRTKAFISAEHYATLGDHSVNPGDLLVAGLGDDKMPAGRACIAPSSLGPALVKADCFRFRLCPDLLVPTFLSYQLSATAAAASACLSTGATRLRINLSATAARTVALPPVAEQERIIAHVESACAPLNLAILKVGREIEFLREYRTRLIADVVTGKLDVRAAAAKLPDTVVDENVGEEPDDDLDEAELDDEETPA